MISKLKRNRVLVLLTLTILLLLLFVVGNYPILAFGTN